MLNLLLQTTAAGQPQSQLPFFMMMGAIFMIFYFMLIRPQNKRMKAHRAKIDSIARGDTIVTNGGLVGKVLKVHEGELTVDLGNAMKVTVVQGMIADVRNKTVPANDTGKGKGKS